MTNQSKDTNKHNTTTARLFFEIDNKYKPHPSITNWDIASAVLRHLIIKMDVEYCGSIPFLEIIAITQNKQTALLAIQTLEHSLLVNAQIENEKLDYYVDPEAIFYPVTRQLYRVRRSWKPMIAFDYSAAADSVVFGISEFSKLNISFAAKAVYALLLAEPDIGNDTLTNWLSKQASNCTTYQAELFLKELMDEELLELSRGDWIVHDISDLGSHDRLTKMRPHL
ncbi:MAG: hypothetical protein ACK5NL_09450 [Vibrio fluvialis]